jgi:hypothetical protein
LVQFDRLPTVVAPPARTAAPPAAMVASSGRVNTGTSPADRRSSVSLGHARESEEPRAKGAWPYVGCPGAGPGADRADLRREDVGIGDSCQSQRVRSMTSA